MLLIPSSEIAVLGLGFLLGLKHATDPDHIVAVTTFVGNEQKLQRACVIGLFWGFGHTLALTAAGTLVIALRIPMSLWLAARLELLVAAMLVVLGVRVIATVHNRWHARHHELEWPTSGIKPLLVGIVHGAAGSAALVLLVLSTISSLSTAFLYIVVFGIGSLVGMLAVSILLSIPLYFIHHRIPHFVRPIQVSAGVFSCLFGIYLGCNVWLSLP
jgi:hypothetical protein